MSSLTRWLIALCVTLIVALPIQANDVIDRLHDFFKSTRAIQADFRQSLMDARGAKVQEASGTLVMQRPGKFRWDYQRPYHQLIVADGKAITIYDEDLQQATIKVMSGVIGSTPALLLSGAQPLEASFNIAAAVPREGLEWVELTPKQPDSGFERIRLGFDRNDLQAMEMLDSFGQTTSLRFSNIKHNVTPPPGAFAFTPPAGTDIVRETGQ